MIGMGAEASTIVRAEAADFFCDFGAVKIPSDERVGDVPGSVHYHAKVLDWNLSRISMLKVKAVPQNCTP
jgi:hypothetical protein